MKTAIVINAGLGGLTLGVMQAGYHVIAAYESDEKALRIHQRNLNIPAFEEIPMERVDKEWQEIDLLAARLHFHPLSAVNGRNKEPNQNNSIIILELLKRCYPRNFLFFVNVSGFKRRSEYLREMVNIGYRIEYRTIDVGKAVGFPVSENTLCVVGSRNDIDRQFFFSS